MPGKRERRASEQDTRTTAYDDLMNRPRPVSTRHAPMSRTARAAQFSPFAALRGYEEAVEETARLTDVRRALDEAEQERIDRQLQALRDRLDARPVVRLTYFAPDARKAGGAYRTVRGVVRRIDTVRRMITLEDGRELALDDLMKVEDAE